MTVGKSLHWNLINNMDIQCIRTHNKENKTNMLQFILHAPCEEIITWPGKLRACDLLACQYACMRLFIVKKRRKENSNLMEKKTFDALCSYVCVCFNFARNYGKSEKSRECLFGMRIIEKCVWMCVCMMSLGNWFTSVSFFLIHHSVKLFLYAVSIQH